MTSIDTIRSDDAAAYPGLSAMLPLRGPGSKDGRDFERAEMLFRSLRAATSPSTFDDFLIVTPDSDYHAVRERFGAMSGFPVTVVREYDIAPELQAHAKLSGWTKQQLLKIIVSARTVSAFTLTFDADIVCLNRFDRETLLPGGRGLIDTPMDHWHRPWWWTASARLLGVSPPESAQSIGVTPVLMARAISVRLIERLQQRARRGDWLSSLVAPLKPYALQQLHPRFRAHYRWSEYTLYFLAAQHERLLDVYHVRGGSPDLPIRLLSRQSVFDEEEDLRRWSGIGTFKNEDTALFMAIHSKLGFLPSYVNARLGDLGLSWKC
jgi:hypothetical protein